MYDWLGTLVGFLALGTYATLWLGYKIAHLAGRIDRGQR